MPGSRSGCKGEGSLPGGVIWANDSIGVEELSHPKSRAPMVVSRAHRECKAENKLACRRSNNKSSVSGAKRVRKGPVSEVPGKPDGRPQ